LDVIDPLQASRVNIDGFALASEITYEGIPYLDTWKIKSTIRVSRVSPGRFLSGKSTYAHRTHLHRDIGAGRPVVHDANYRPSRKARHVVGRVLATNDDTCTRVYECTQSADCLLQKGSARSDQSPRLEPVLIDNFLKLRYARKCLDERDKCRSAIAAAAAAAAANDSPHRKDKRSHFVNQTATSCRVQFYLIKKNDNRN